MKKSIPSPRPWLSLLVAAGLTLGATMGRAQNGAAQPAAQGEAVLTPVAWTLDEALEHMQHYPRDPYLQYVAMQLARRELRVRDVETMIERLRWGQQPRMQRTQRVDLFSIFSGSLAVQESLQLDAMREQQQPAQRAAPPVPLADLEGPTIKSHPWTEMLGGRQPPRSPLAGHVPDDFYYVKFRSVNKLLELLDVGDLWGTHLFSQTQQAAYTNLTAVRLQKQLAVETNALLRPFYDLAIEELAITGSDLYVVQGSDVTLLFRYRQKPVFQKQMELFLQQAEENNPGVVRSQGRYRDVPFVHLTSPDRSVHVYAAYPAEGLHVRSNSQAAFQRVLDVIVGAAPSLGASDEFAYIRTLMAYGAAEEDGLIYFSDPFIRRMVGPQVKLTERRRVICSSQTRMIGHAAALYETQYGRPAKSLAELAAADCVPGNFGAERLACPCGGEYTLAAGGTAGACSYHGRSGSLRPGLEIPLAVVSQEEAQQYRAFVSQYNQYWRTFFDPIAVRVQISAKQYRIETIVLPLIDNSIYSGLAAALGGAPERLDALPVPQRNIFSTAVKMDKAGLLEKSGWRPPPAREQDEPARPAVDRHAPVSSNRLKQMALALHNYHDTFKTFPAVANFDSAKRPLLSWRVHLLPFLGEMELYEKFRRDEPWDSEHNRALILQIPEIYVSPGRKSPQPGTTTYLAPVGPDTVFRGDDRGVRIAEITDGTSNTIMLLDAAEKHAVIWSKPGDLVYDRAGFRESLFGRFGQIGLAAFADAAVMALPDSTPDETLHAMITRNGGERVQNPARTNAQRRREWDVLGIQRMTGGQVDERQMYEFVTRGIGNQIGLHVYDADPLFDFQLVNFLGQMSGSFANRRGLSIGNETMMIAFLVASLNAPVYLSVPLEDTQVTDAFLAHVDKYLAGLARAPQGVGFFRVEQDFYQLPIGEHVSARSMGIQFGPVKWRFFWARIGEGLYVASKPEILEDLAALVEAGEAGAAERVDSTAHALMRIRPEHWQRVLPAYRMGWAERHRQACLDNVGRLSGLARLATARRKAGQPPLSWGELDRLARQVHGVSCYCPEQGRYLPSEDGKRVTCSIHGAADHPRQAAVPADNGSIDRLLRNFAGLTVALTFLEDGLHAVLTIERE